MAPGLFHGGRRLVSQVSTHRLRGFLRGRRGTYGDHGWLRRETKLGCLKVPRRATQSAAFCVAGVQLLGDM